MEIPKIVGHKASLWLQHYDKNLTLLGYLSFLESSDICYLGITWEYLGVTLIMPGGLYYF